MKKGPLACLFVLLYAPLLAQWPPDSLLRHTVEHALQVLAGDSLQGRGNFTEGLHKAGTYIAANFEEMGLTTYPRLEGYFQHFGKAGEKQPFTGGAKEYDHGKVLRNVVGVLPGRSKPGEAMIISAHYDGLGSVRKTVYNGANDNASGTTAMLALARYFVARGDNERTIIFCAFAGEELGLLGSAAFVAEVNEDSIVAVINLEMLGQPMVGKNTFFITGASYSSLQRIMERNLAGAARITDDPLPDHLLFRRSDNFPFAAKGIPAHTLMASDDTSPCYHSPCDDIRRLDIPNMVKLVRSIAQGVQGIVDGKDTPSRLNAATID